MKDIPGIDEDGNPKNGPFKLFFKNGLVSCQGEFDNGMKSGTWQYFLNNGQLQSSGRFKDGRIVGRWEWFFKTGEPRATGGFDDEEQKHGEWKRYHANGQLWDEGCFEHGKKRGPQANRMLLTAFSALLVLSAIGVVFAMNAQVALRRGGLASLFACWAVGTIGVTALWMWRIGQQQELPGISPVQSGALPVRQWFLEMWALTFAVVCLRIWRRRGSTNASLLRSAAATLPIFFGGRLLCFVIFAAIDARALFW